MFLKRIVREMNLTPRPRPLYSEIHCSPLILRKTVFNYLFTFIVTALVAFLFCNLVLHHTASICLQKVSQTL